MDPAESIKNLTFSLSVLDAAPVLKADALTKNKSKKKGKEGGRGRRREGEEEAGQERENIGRHVFTIPKGY